MNLAPYTLARTGLSAAKRLTARGTDINLIPQYPKPRQMILQATRDCAAMITVCAALKDEIVDLGGTVGRVTALRNGVDLQLFTPEDKPQARAAFGMPDEFAIASVGHLIERKGHHLVIEALAQIPMANSTSPAAAKKKPACAKPCRSAVPLAPTLSNSAGSPPPTDS